MRLRTVTPQTLYQFNQQLITYGVKSHFTYSWLHFSDLGFSAVQTQCDAARLGSVSGPSIFSPGRYSCVLLKCPLTFFLMNQTAGASQENVSFSNFCEHFIHRLNYLYKQGWWSDIQCPTASLPVPSVEGKSSGCCPYALKGRATCTETVPGKALWVEGLVLQVEGLNLYFNVWFTFRPFSE